MTIIPVYLLDQLDPPAQPVPQSLRHLQPPPHKLGAAEPGAGAADGVLQRRRRVAGSQLALVSTFYEVAGKSVL